jgi:ribosomal protein L16/L10AE
MGKGKGSISKYVAFVRKGQIICELSSLDRISALSILKLVSSKLPVKVRIVVY